MGRVQGAGPPLTASSTPTAGNRTNAGGLEIVLPRTAAGLMLQHPLFKDGFQLHKIDGKWKAFWADKVGETYDKAATMGLLRGVAKACGEAQEQADALASRVTLLTDYAAARPDSGLGKYVQSVVHLNLKRLKLSLSLTPNVKLNQ